MEDIAEESREEETYENLRKRLSVPVTVRVPLRIHYTMLGVDGAKEKSKSFDAPPAVGDPEHPDAGQEPQASAAAPPPPPTRCSCCL